MITLLAPKYHDATRCYSLCPAVDSAVFPNPSMIAMTLNSRSPKSTSSTHGGIKTRGTERTVEMHGDATCRSERSKSKGVYMQRVYMHDIRLPTTSCLRSKRIGNVNLGNQCRSHLPSMTHDPDGDSKCTQQCHLYIKGSQNESSGVINSCVNRL